MKDTRQRILNTALGLFNETGTTDVTLRKIAREMNISQGNLNYHFRLKEDIIEALYFSLVAEMDAQMSGFRDAAPNLKMLYQASYVSMSKMFDYRFLLIDFIKIMSEHERIRIHYQHLQKIRAGQFLQIFDFLIEDGLMRKPELKNEYERLYERMNIMGDSWINVYTTFYKEKNLAYFCDLLFETIYPYLTSKGKKKYAKAKSSNNK
ncbi:MAG: TetR/AcrR family transcriptional regulator [Cyclobacteriaceae bacterium]